jgi:predicted dehydrogenase
MEIIFNDREIDGVFIFLPEHWRALAAIKACRARKDVYVKSLPVHGIWEGQQVEKAANKYKRIVQCGFPFRSSSSVLEARDYILSGKLGQIVHLNIFDLNEPGYSENQAGSDLPDSLDWDSWLGPASYRPYDPAIYDSENTPGKKVFWDFNSGRMTGISHAIDLARMVIGDPGHPSSVYGYANRQTDQNEYILSERQVVTYNYEKFTMNCEIGSGYNYMKNAPITFKGDENPQQWLFRSERVEIYGIKGLMYLDSKEGSWQVFGFGGDKTGKIYSDISMRTGQVEILHKEGGTDHPKLHIGNFIDCVRSRNLPSANIKQGHLSSTLVHLGNIAIRAGNRQLIFDAGKEIFIGNDEANRLLKNEYREGYEIPVKV